MSKRIDVLAGATILIIGIILLCSWRYNPGFRVLYSGDSFLDANQLIPGSNFKELGFWKLRFTADYAVGPEEYHPFYYTHNGPLSEMINGFYQKLGLERIERQRLVCIAWTLLGLAFFYAALRLLAGQTVALGALIINGSNPFILSWGDNLFSSYQWMLVYLAFYSLMRHIRKRSLLSFRVAWVAFFLVAFSNYELVPQIAIFVLGLAIFRIERISARKVAIFLIAPLAAFCLRNLLVIWAVGYHIWSRDLIEILLHRSVGIKTPIMEMYRYAPVIMWDTEAVIPRHFLQSLYLKLEGLYGYGWSLFIIALFVPRSRNWLLPKREILKVYPLILVFFFMGVSWFLLFPQHTSAHLHGSTMLLFSPFSGLLWSCVLIGLWKNVARIPVKALCLAAVICFIAVSRIINFVPPERFPGIEALDKYRGRVFCTNAIPSLVEYYTKAPAAFCGYEEQFNDLLEGKYNFFLRTDKLNAPFPEFFLSVSMFGWNKDRLAGYFPLVESGKDYAIYRLERKEGQ
ncbi:MAG: hypothetical protein WC301_06100 [Candidatus Omnitrophota bacterium]|jgi:hypothetical protein